MASSAPLPLVTEPTDAGEQTLVPGVTPITQNDRLAVLMAAPLTPRREQKPLDIGLFDDGARRQMNLF